jgi:FtsH-binding integral membrane protein
VSCLRPSSSTRYPQQGPLLSSLPFANSPLLLLCIHSAWSFWVPLVGSFASLGCLMWKIHSHPLNLVILGVFTIFEATSVGMVISFYQTEFVLFLIPYAFSV